MQKYPTSFFLWSHKQPISCFVVTQKQSQPVLKEFFMKMSAHNVQFFGWSLICYKMREQFTKQKYCLEEIYTFHFFRV